MDWTGGETMRLERHAGWLEAGESWFGTGHLRILWYAGHSSRPMPPPRKHSLLRFHGCLDARCLVVAGRVAVGRGFSTEGPPHLPSTFTAVVEVAEGSRV